MSKHLFNGLFRYVWKSIIYLSASLFSLKYNNYITFGNIKRKAKYIKCLFDEML